MGRCTLRLVRSSFHGFSDYIAYVIATVCLGHTWVYVEYEPISQNLTFSCDLDEPRLCLLDIEVVVFFEIQHWNLRPAGPTQNSSS